MSEGVLIGVSEGVSEGVLIGVSEDALTHPTEWCLDTVALIDRPHGT